MLPKEIGARIVDGCRDLLKLIADAGLGIGDFHSTAMGNKKNVGPRIPKLVKNLTFVFHEKQYQRVFGKEFG